MVAEPTHYGTVPFVTTGVSNIPAVDKIIRHVLTKYKNTFFIFICFYGFGVRNFIHIRNKYSVIIRTIYPSLLYHIALVALQCPGRFTFIGRVFINNYMDYFFRKFFKSLLILFKVEWFLFYLVSACSFHQYKFIGDIL